MRAISLGGAKELLERSRDMRTMVTFHSVGDTDAVASAIGVAAYLNNAKVSTPDIITSNARRMLRRLNYADLIGNSFYDDATFIVLVDANNFESCGAFKQRLKGFRGTALVLDHHASSTISGGAEIFVFDSEEFTSASGIVYELLKATGFGIERRLATLLALGIVADSAEFKNANAMSFRHLGELLALAGKDYASLMHEFGSVPGAEARMRAAECLRAAQMEIRGGMFFVHGVAAGAANICADYALKAGADIALFVSERENEVSFSARMRPPLDRQTGIHMGRIMARLAPIIGGTGGGHPCAAGAYGPANAHKSEFVAAFEEMVFGEGARRG